MNDARFEDGKERPLRLIARDAADLRVLSALVQDAVLTGADLAFNRRARRFSLLLNRFRWEDRARAGGEGGPVERVRSVLDFGDVLRVTQQGMEPRSGDTVLSLLSIGYTAADADPNPDANPDPNPDPGPDQPAGPGRVMLVFSGDGAIALDVECLEVHLADVTRPYAAPSRRVPAHRLIE